MNLGAPYLLQTYEHGITNWSWDTQFYDVVGQYPLDGIGYHIYCDGGTDDVSTVTEGYNYNIQDVWQNGVMKGETLTHPNNNVYGIKYLYVSEFGWDSNAIGIAAQAVNVQTAYVDVFANMDTGGQFVKLAMWFNLQDFATSAWGLMDTNHRKKTSWYAFVNVTQS